MNYLRLLLLFILSTSTLFGELPEPYRSTKVLPFDPHGWFGNATPLASILDQKKPLVVVEVGSWLGCSTRFIAEHLPANGVVYAVDTWQGSPLEAVHMQDPRLPYLYQQFLSNIIHAGLTDKVIPIRMSSQEASSALNLKFDLCYLDASHDTASVINDIHMWYPLLKDGGVLCGDDWMWASVREAVIHCALEMRKEIGVCENFWWYYD